MNKLRTIFWILILCTLGVASDELSVDMEAEAASHHRNGEVSMDVIDRILKQLEDSETLTQQLLDRVEQLESRDQLQQEEIRNLKRALNRRGGENNDSKKPRYRSKMLKNRHVTSRKHSTILRDLGEENEIATKSVPDSHIARIQSSAHQQTIRQLADNPTHVAFLATLSHHQEHIGVHQAIIFDNVITNIGNAYHNHIGSFIAPFQGTYVLSATLLSKYQTDGSFEFTKNGSPVTRLILRGSGGGYSTSSQTIVLSLQKGDDINIHNIELDKSVNGNDYSIFSGFLLFEDENPAIVG